MKRTLILIAFAAAAALVGAAYGLYQFGLQRGMQMAKPPASSKTIAAPNDKIDPETGRRVLYWHDPMVPGQKFERPGKSPYMDMPLVPVFADADNAQAAGIDVASGVQQKLGLRTATAELGALAPAVQAVGSVAWNERELAVVQARANGYVERLLVRAPFEPVRKGQALAELYVPDWVAAQEDFFAVARMTGSGASQDLSALRDAAHQRMRLAGMSEEQIRQVEASGKPQARLIVAAPVGGVVAELTAREGMTVATGTPLFRINGLSSVWVYAEIPESMAALVRPGNAVEARSPAVPGVVFKGRVSALLPDVNPATRTLRARIELANPGQRLVPGMFANLGLTPDARKQAVLVPSEALIETGTRSLVIVVGDDGKFVPTEVEPGIESAGRTEIRRGVAAGQKVVVSGQFLLDSEASLKGLLNRLGGTAPDPHQQHTPTPAPPDRAAQQGHDEHQGHEGHAP